VTRRSQTPTERAAQGATPLSAATVSGRVSSTRLRWAPSLDGAPWSCLGGAPWSRESWERWEVSGAVMSSACFAGWIAPLAMMRKSAWFCRPISSTRSYPAPTALWTYRTCPLPHITPSVTLAPSRLAAKPLLALRRNLFSPSPLRPSGRGRPFVVNTARTQDDEGDARQLVG
jgi:hypothetical protein